MAFGSVENLLSSVISFLIPAQQLDDSTRGGALSFAKCSAGRWPVIMKRTSKSRSRSRSRSMSMSALSAETLDLNGQPLRQTMMANPEMSESANVASCSVGSASIFEFGQQLVGFAGHGQCGPEAEPNQSAEDEHLCQELLDEVKNQIVSASSDAAQCVVQDVTWTFENLTISSESSDASNVQVCFFGGFKAVRHHHISWLFEAASCTDSNCVPGFLNDIFLHCSALHHFRKLLLVQGVYN